MKPTPSMAHATPQPTGGSRGSMEEQCAASLPSTVLQGTVCSITPIWPTQHPSHPVWPTQHPSNPTQQGAAGAAWRSSVQHYSHPQSCGAQTQPGAWGMAVNGRPIMVQRWQAHHGASVAGPSRSNRWQAHPGASWCIGGRPITVHHGA